MQYIQKSLWFILGFWLLWRGAGFFEIAHNVSAFYPAPALSIAFIALYGLRFAPVVFLAAILASYPPHGFWEYVPREWWQGLRQCLVYSLAGYSIRHILSCNLPLMNSKDAFSFIGIAAFFSFVSAIVAGSLFWTYDTFPVDIIPEITVSFWTGDGAGVIMAFPLLALLLSELQHKKIGSILQSALSLGPSFYGFTILLPMLFAAAGFGATVWEGVGNNLGYVIVLPVVWLASRNGIVGGAIAALSANMSAAFVFAQIGHGDYSVVELQVLFALTSAIGIVVGAAFDERRASDAQYKRIIEGTEDLVTTVTSDGVLTFVNHMSTKFFGLSPKDCIGRLAFDFIHPEDRERTLKSFQGWASQKVPSATFQNRQVSLSDEVHSMMWTINLQYDQEGNLLSINSIARDVTAMKEIEKELQEAHDNLEQRVETRTEELAQANLAKTKFLAAASHDLRQPLQAINLFLSVLTDREYDSKNREIINRIGLSVHGLDELLNALLDVSKLEAELVVPEQRQFAIGDVLDRLASEFRQVAKESGIEFRTVACKANVFSDPVLLDNILRNILANAIKYTEQGKILLGCRHRNGSLLIEVWDTGIGISNEHQEQIFQEFFQVGNSSRDQKKGLGLGLSIVSKTAALLGHRIAVQSVAGKGTVFSVEMPITDLRTKNTKHEVPKQIPRLLGHPLVVVIEDNLDVQDSIKVLLKSWGCRVLAVPCVDRDEMIRCQSCESCNELFKPTTATPELIIADYNLTDGMTGIEAVDIVNEHFKAEIPAFLLTGDINPEHLITIEKSGLPVLHKPIKGEVLREAVYDALGSNLMSV